MHSSTRTLSLITLCLAAVLSLFTPPAAADPALGAVSGRVFSSEGHPLAATVTVRASTGQLLFTTTADTFGHFKVELSPGDYVLTVAAAGHTSQTRAVTIAERDMIHLIFILQQRNHPF